MTSMLLTLRYAVAAAGAAAGIGTSTKAGGPVRGHHCGAPLRGPAQESLAQSRGVMLFSFAYFAADSSIILRSIALSDGIQSLTIFHSLPSHVWNFTSPEPS